MEGVETALLVNDACGSPVPWLVCCPWLFFDGKLFHTKLSRTQIVRDLHELCDHRVELIMKAEKLRKAILEGLVLTPLPRPSPLAPMHDPSCKCITENTCAFCNRSALMSNFSHRQGVVLTSCKDL